MMRDAECKPISEESWRFYEIALQDDQISIDYCCVDGLLLFVY